MLDARPRAIPVMLKDEMDADASRPRSQSSMIEALLEAAVDAIITIRADGTIETANPAAVRLFKYDRDSFIGRDVTFLMPEPYRSEHDRYLQRYMATGTRRIIGIGREVTGLRSDGTAFPMHLSVGEFHVDGETFFTGIIHDLTERKRSEQVLQQAQKMEAIGQLTGGIAHDFNNLLTIIIGNLELLERHVPGGLPQELLSEAQEASDLGSRLTARLLAFARRSALEPQLVDLNGLALGLTDMLQRTLGETILLSSALSPDLWTTRTDPSQLESAVVNLAVNARDAMPKGGKLVLETRNAVIGEDHAVMNPGLTPGEYVQLSVTDTGHGMTEEVRQRVFEPFFTTKERGRGTGLGLSMVFGFASQSGGSVTIYSEPGVGTTVNIYLPRIADGEQVAPEAGHHETEFAAEGEKVLVVEDDDRVRRLTSARLRELGYSVVEAPDAAKALDVIEAEYGIDLVFTDLVMPGEMSGYDLCEQVRVRWPGMKVLLTSGYAEELVNSDRLAAERVRLLRKPYRQVELARIVREVLDD